MIPLLITAAIVGLLFAFYYVVGRGERVRPAAGVRVLAYSIPYRATGIYFGVVLAGVMAYLFVFDPPDSDAGRVAVAAVGLTSAAAGWVMILEGFRTRFVLTDEGVAKFSWLYAPQYFPWAEVAQVGRGQWGDVVVRHTSGAKFSVPTAALDNGEWFVEACRTHLTPDQCPGLPKEPGDA